MPTEQDESFAQAVIRLRLADEASVGECMKTVADGDAPSLAEAMVERGVLDRAAADRAARERGAGDSSSDDAPPEIDAYEMLEKLGEGGMGSVWKARQTSLDRLVAIKVLPRLFSKSKKFIERFRREALATARLNHPHIVSAIDVGVQQREGEPDLYYFVMEYVDGETIEDIIDREGGIRPKRTVDIAIAVAGALDHAWTEAGIVHRDIKPANIMITRKGEVKLADLGLARSVHESANLTTAGLAIGTPHYVSPEQAQGKKEIDIRSDIYSIGATMFHMLTARTPFDGDSAAAVMAKHVSEDAPSCHDVNPTVPMGLSAVITKMMQRDPAERYQTPGEVLGDLDRFKKGDRPLAYTRMLLAYESSHGASGSPSLEVPLADVPEPGTERAKAPSWRWTPLVTGLLFLVATGFLVWYVAGLSKSGQEDAAVGAGGDAETSGPAKTGDRKAAAVKPGTYTNPVALSFYVLSPGVPKSVVGPRMMFPPRLHAGSRVRCLVRPARPAYGCLIMVTNGGPWGSVKLQLLVPASGRPAPRLKSKWNAFPETGEPYELPASASTVAFVAVAGREPVVGAAVARSLERISRELSNGGRGRLARIPDHKTLWYGHAGKAWATGGGATVSGDAAAVLGAVCEKIRAIFKHDSVELSGAATSYGAPP